MPRATIDRLIVNSPYKEPAKHWSYDRKTRLFDLVDGRRPAGYVVASSDSEAFDDPGVFVEIWGIHLTQVTPTSCGWAHGASASQSATIDRYGVGSTATACCTRR